ncbi:hypothetical protein ACFVUS_27420 [Nocardia sp. NPDC058058]|uniref:Rv0361 family membrane protein n=1 Tax=Nocardia sp. NPDC058058 TaxID=3346317 RepID=UPI0036DB0390
MLGLDRLTRPHAALVSAAVLIAICLGGVPAHADTAPVDDTRSAIEQAVTRHIDARNSGDLTTLRNTACGAIAEDYRDFGPLVDLVVWWQGPGQGRTIHLERFTGVEITDQSAIADTELRISTATGPQQVSFMLERAAEGWQVCSTDRPIP